MNIYRRLIVMASAVLLLSTPQPSAAAEEETGNCPDCFQANIVWWNNCRETGHSATYCASTACNSLFTNCNRYCNWASFECPFYGIL